ncbi:TRAP dicarboxylate transporter, DctQ subunit, unknown substrate 5 [Candidatus Rhodobacter oscarellae]|uniref:TRAP transporter small permease protein n=1 Tax=Candidatus Rhodobacter oscarellae TaxID=1675527 RepID=A0A0J9H3K9_9RHOB|nr:TRAP transporter small permease [Candidatus Rhodobacter lobularis]KMW60253.1 TRAP dicarboxylate transporter, DctQ subunit, unknown substrate 5 [Candidatus Rhodobacter lobularis]
MSTVRRALDALYFAAGVLAALCLIVILALIVIQMLARWPFTAPVFFPITEAIPGIPEYAGYAMATASFLAFANALNKGSHIRVSLLLNALGPRARWVMEIWCFVIATAVGWYVCYYIYRMLGFAIQFNDVSQGQDATPLWIAQTPMMVGAVILAIALTDNLLNLIFTGKHRIVRDVADGHSE